MAAALSLWKVDISAYQRHDISLDITNIIFLSITPHHCSLASPVTDKTAKQHCWNSLQTLAGALHDVSQGVGGETVPASYLPGDHKDQRETPDWEPLTLQENSLLQGDTAELQGTEAAEDNILDWLTNNTRVLDSLPCIVQQINEDQYDCN